MSDNEFQNLGRRLLACEAFRWLPGMAVWDLHCAERQRVLAVDEKNWAALSALGAEPTWTSPDFIEDNGWLPDLRDAATKGCVLELVRELGETLLRHAVGTAMESETGGPFRTACAAGLERARLKLRLL